MITSDGKDLSPLLQGNSSAMHRIAVTEFAWSKSVRKGKYRLVYFPPAMFKADYPEGFGELYDLEVDPWEMRNLYFESAYREVILDLQRDLLDWLVTTTHPVTVHPPVSRPAGRQEYKRYHNLLALDGKLPPAEIATLPYRSYL
ncbi:MAG: hypothetical protein A2340_14985 [Lentisphaerae bacterium RIFOXYB12_FULL_60_10]|nr:MAG: hypothetical protein A2340_14985 [Lentisphaerae bacterium RIFOXYB12_FULL_60_10]